MGDYMATLTTAAGTPANNVSTDLPELAYTQNIRKQIIEKLTINNTVPDDKDMQSFLIKALDGMDRSAVAKAKVKIESSSAAAQQDTADLMAMILLKTHAGIHAPRGEPRASVELDNSYILLDTVPGEMEQGTQTLTDSLVAI
jgi:hypothetical protein